MEVEIIAREKIKPSSPTPQNLRILNLSLLDQLMFPMYIRTVMLYPTTHNLNDTPKRLQLLKKSLSETLNRFYPLAGKLRDDISIDCDDEGANFVEARVHCTLHQFLSQPDFVSSLEKFLPCELVLMGSGAGACITNVQVNVFECGGIGIALCVSHKVVDFSSITTFVKAWTATARDDFSVIPSFAACSLFPAVTDLSTRSLHVELVVAEKNCVRRRFVFDGPAITSLKARSSSSSTGFIPSRVEAVSALIMKCMIAAAQERHGGKPRPSLMTHAVNLRSRMSPPLSDKGIGNFVLEVGRIRSAEQSRELVELARELRDAISKVDVKKLGAEILEKVKERDELASKEGVDYVAFTSWCRFGLYEVADFGWGKPVWITNNVSDRFKNLVVLVDTRLGDGIEAWITMDEQEMNIITKNNQHHDLLQYAALDPNPLIYSPQT
ncbi:vinorine synthase-like [Carica papaya]|uniref:vinorine synthase-like n=1 Tax=Carica papaya TaxID=3649 RepID=UPI000B8CEAF5|nr:vinorine synthase-like [Carica papaya]